MTQRTRGPRVHERWAHLRFSVIGQLLAAPPPKGELKAAIAALAERTWQHQFLPPGMRPLMNVSKNRHGTYYAIKRVPTLGVIFRHPLDFDSRNRMTHFDFASIFRFGEAFFASGAP